MTELFSDLPPELVGLVLTLGLSLLVGLERETKRQTEEVGFFGGIRTFPLIGLTGFLLLLIFPESPVPFGGGLLALGALLVVSYHRSVGEDRMGITTEVSALLTYGVGAAAAAGFYWVAIASGVVAVLLLHEKERLERWAINLPRHEKTTLVRFLLLAGVVLPVVPNRPFTPFDINPFTLWLVVVAVSGVSYLSYLLQLWWGRKRGLLLSAVLGGAYSSTATTVVLARRARRGVVGRWSIVGATVAATGMMYPRLWLLILLFAPRLAAQLTLPFWIAGILCVTAGTVLTARARGEPPDTADPDDSRSVSQNPLELSSAFVFGALFLILLVGTRLVSQKFGNIGVLLLGAVMGAADVDPFILGLTQSIGDGLDLSTATFAVLVAAAANNVMKGVYSIAFGTRRTGLPILAALAITALITVAVYLPLTTLGG